MYVLFIYKLTLTSCQDRYMDVCFSWTAVYELTVLNDKTLNSVSLCTI